MMSSSRLIRLHIGLFSILLLAMLGCNRGPRTGTVEGKVTFEGKAVTEGFVVFLSTTGEGGTFESELKEEGKYVMKSPVIVGDYVVIVRPAMHMVDTDPGKSPPAPMEKPAPNIPERYRQQGASTLKAKVNEGKNNLDFNMTKAP